MHKGKWIVLTGTAMLLAACSDQQPVTPPITADATGSQVAAPDGATTGAVTPPASAAADAPAPKAASGVDYAAYVGKYPFDEIGGARFLSRPEVISAVRAALGNDALFRTISATEGPSTPMFARGGKVGSWACEAHNCGDHQWTVLFDPATRSAEVCYHNAETTGTNSLWYAGGRETRRDGDCPSE